MRDMPIVKCKICKKSFYAKPSWIKEGGGKYCSVSCHHESLKSGRVVKCSICNKEIYRARRDLWRAKNKKYFCNKSCQTIWRNSVMYVGPRHPNWKGGESTYKAVLLRNKVPQFCRKCRTRDSKVLAVHHLDHNRKNNSLNNLIWLCHNCHFLIHHYEKIRRTLMETMV